MNMQPDLLLLTPKVAFAPEPVKAIRSALWAALTEPEGKLKKWFTMEPT